MPTISRVTTSYSTERTAMYKDDKDAVSAIHMFSLFDINGTRISRTIVDFELMEVDLTVGNNPTITYKI